MWGSVLGRGLHQHPCSSSSQHTPPTTCQHVTTPQSGQSTAANFKPHTYLHTTATHSYQCTTTTRSSRPAVARLKKPRGPPTSTTPSPRVMLAYNVRSYLRVPTTRVSRPAAAQLKKPHSPPTSTTPSPSVMLVCHMRNELHPQQPPLWLLPLLLPLTSGRQVLPLSDTRQLLQLLPLLLLSNSCKRQQAQPRGLQPSTAKHSSSGCGWVRAFGCIFVKGGGEGLCCSLQ